MFGRHMHLNSRASASTACGMIPRTFRSLAALVIMLSIWSLLRHSLPSRVNGKPFAAVGHNSVVLPSGGIVDVLVLTYSDDTNTWLCHMLATALQQSISVKVLGFEPAPESPKVEHGWQSSTKFQTMLRLWALEQEIGGLPDDTIILWLDADTMFEPHRDNRETPLQAVVSEFFSQTGGVGLVWSAQKTCWPNGGPHDVACRSLRKINPSGYSYLNCGGMIGRVSNIRRLFAIIRREMKGQTNLYNPQGSELLYRTLAVLPYGNTTECYAVNDQAFMTCLFVKEAYRRDVGMTIDVFAKIFQTLDSAGGGEDIGRDTTGSWKNSFLQSRPLLLHLSGDGKIRENYRRFMHPIDAQTLSRVELLGIRKFEPDRKADLLCSKCAHYWHDWFVPAGGFHQALPCLHRSNLAKQKIQ